MATLEQEQQQRTTLGKLLDELASRDSGALVRTDLGKGLDFSTGVIYFSRTLRLFSDLAQSSLDGVPFSRLQQLTNVVQQAKTQFEAIDQFSLEKYPQNPVAQRDQLINAIRDQYDGQFDVVAPVIAYSVRKGTDFAKLESDAKATVDRVNAVAADHQKRMEDALEQASSVVEQVRKAAQEVGVAQQAIHFSREATEHERQSRLWLWATAGAAALTLLYGVAALILFNYLVGDLSVGQSIQLAAAKLILFTLFFYAVVWCARTYRGHVHNYVVNKHRQNALSTFETFAKAAADEQTKGAVLLQATQAIFAPQVSGFVTQESESGSSPSQVLEIVRSMTGQPGH